MDSKLSDKVVLVTGASGGIGGELVRVALANIHPVGAITKGREGKELAEIGSMHRRGAVAFSDDGVGVADASVMRRALQYAKMFDGLITQHCEDPALSGGAMQPVNGVRFGTVDIQPNGPRTAARISVFSPTGKVWGLVTVTDNATQQVAAYWPQ